jgi:hypothetical protein
MTTTPDGTTLGIATKIVEEWKVANDLRFLSPRASRDLAERIERAMRKEQDGRPERRTSAAVARMLGEIT